MKMRTASAPATPQVGALPKTMRALVKEQAGPGMSLREVPVPAFGPTDVLIRVRKAGICGTDGHIWEWDKWAQSRIVPPLIVGHEFMGVVAAVGSAVRGVSVGERVSAEGHVVDGTCLLCRTGQANLCERVQVIGVDRDGCFADYIAMPEGNVWRLDPSVPDDWAAVFDPLGNAVHTVMTADVSTKSVVITGVGSIGLMAIPVARAAGAAKVIAIDVNPRKLELAHSLGADEVFDSRTPGVREHVLALTNGDGADVLLEMSGNGAALDLGLSMVRNGGRAALLGLPSDTVNIKLAEHIIFKGLDRVRHFRAQDVRDVVSDAGAGQEQAGRTGTDHHKRAAARALRGMLRDAQGGQRGQDRHGLGRGRVAVNQVFNRKLKTDLDVLREAGTFKHLRHITTPMGATVHMAEAGDAIVLSSNNYLGLADNPRVVEAGIEGLRHYGAGTASVRFICGTLDIHKRLEERIARFFGTENSLTYVSCWAANTGLIPTIAVEGTAIVSDELNHASIIDGCRMATQAQRLRYKHADMADLEAKLANLPPDVIKFIISDGVFSMEGDLAKLPEIVALAKRYNAVTIVDDSHGTGVMGRTGRGTIEHFGLTGQIDIITGTLGKALGGAAGGFVAGSNELVETLIQKSRPQLFSNALPATVACSALAAIEELDAHPDLIGKLRDNISYFRAGLARLGYKPLEGDSAIIPIIVGETAFAIKMSDQLLKEGIFVTGFGFPVVPEGTARIRVQMSAALEREHLDRALAAFGRVGRELS